MCLKLHVYHECHLLGPCIFTAMLIVVPKSCLTFIRVECWCLLCNCLLFWQKIWTNVAALRSILCYFFVICWFLLQRGQKLAFHFFRIPKRSSFSVMSSYLYLLLKNFIFIIRCQIFETLIYNVLCVQKA